MFGDFLTADYGGDWEAVAHGLPARYDVGHHLVVLEGPEVAAQTSETGLHLVGDGDYVVRF